MKVNELTGPALDWAVAKSIGHLEAGRVVVDLDYSSGYDPVRWEPQMSTYYSFAYAPSTDWAQGGPIIERELMRVQPFMGKWIAYIDHTPAHADGPTPLIAAMRCFVASSLGDEIEIPEELK